jgi:hypothetical protein
MFQLMLLIPQAACSAYLLVRCRVYLYIIFLYNRLYVLISVEAGSLTHPSIQAYAVDC